MLDWVRIGSRKRVKLRAESRAVSSRAAIDGSSSVERKAFARLAKAARRIPLSHVGTETDGHLLGDLAHVGDDLLDLFVGEVVLRQAHRQPGDRTIV